MSYKTYVMLRADGSVNSHIVTAGPAPKGYTEVTDPDQASLVQRSQNRAAMDHISGRLVEKTMLKFVPRSRAFIADGVDVMVIDVKGDPGGRRSLTIMVGSPPRELQLPVGEPLEITTSTPGRIPIRLREPMLLAETIVVLAVPAGGLRDAGGGQP